MKIPALTVALLMCLSLPVFAQKQKTPKKPVKPVRYAPPVIREPELSPPPPPSNGDDGSKAPTIMAAGESNSNGYSNNKIATAEDILTTQATTGKPAKSSLPNTLYIYTSNGTMLAYDYKNGMTKRWGIAGKEHGISNGFSFMNHNLYVPTESGKILALNGANGQAFWNDRIGLDNKKRLLRGQVVTGADGIVYVAASNKVLYAINEQNGELVWNYSLPYEWHLYPPVAGYGKLVVTSAPYVFCFEAKTGKLLWNINTGKAMYAMPAVDAKRVYAPDESQTVYALNAETGKTEWKWSMPESQYKIGGNVVLDGNVLYVANESVNSGGAGAIYAINATNGKLQWEHTVNEKEGISSISLQKGLLVGSAGKIIFAINAADGKALQSQEMPKPPLSNVLKIDNTYVYVTAEGVVSASFGEMDATMGVSVIADKGFERATIKMIDKEGIVVPR